MNAAQLAELITAVTALVGSITALVKVVKHTRTHPPASETTRRPATGCTHEDATKGDGVTLCYVCNPELVMRRLASESSSHSTTAGQSHGRHSRHD